MSAPKSTCPDCLELKGECVCPDDEVLDLPPDCGPLIAAMLGGGGHQPGPPYEHVHQFPEEPEDGPWPEYVPFTIRRDDKDGA